jgi:hypothetical protein
MENTMKSLLATTTILVMIGTACAGSFYYPEPSHYQVKVCEGVVKKLGEKDVYTIPLFELGTVVRQGWLQFLMKKLT